MAAVVKRVQILITAFDCDEEHDYDIVVTQEEAESIMDGLVKAGIRFPAIPASSKEKK